VRADPYWPLGRRVPPACTMGALILSLSSAASAKDAVPVAERPDDPLSLMDLLARNGLHDMGDEWWNLYGQFTYITSYHPAFQAPYTNANGAVNSLWPAAERGYTATFTVFTGFRLCPGGEVYAVPEVIAEHPFSLLRGIGGATENFELQKTGAAIPLVYRSRLFLRQTIDLGGDAVQRTSNPLQLATDVKSRRLVFTVGNFSVLDVFDRNNVLGDPRRGFFNESFMTDSSYDFPADARGYTWGAAAELYWDQWAVRFGRFAPPQNPNAQNIDPRFWLYYGDSLELEYDHTLFGRPGAVRVLGYRNHEDIGRFADAIAAFEANPNQNAAACASAGLYNYGSGDFTAPDLCWVRKPNVKLGLGINLDQQITHDVGVFARAMYSDGQTEVDAYDSADRDVSFGITLRGRLWRRPLDVVGAAFATSWISSIHAQYLRMGGVDGFIGDGRLSQSAAPESIPEIFYSANLFASLWLSVDYQRMWNPAYNTDRGPVNIFAGRAHAEF
jgi:high affinity Mn2+ porin